MKIMIITYVFAPVNHVSAIRFTNFSKCLSDLGHDVTVITAEFNKNEVISGDVLSDDVNIKRIKHSNFFNLIKRKTESKVVPENREDRMYNTKNSIVKEHFYKLNSSIKRFIYQFLLNIDWYFQCKKYFKLNNVEKYDVVISTYPIKASHKIGKYISNMGIASKWIVDFRDNMFNDIYSSINNIYYKNLQTRYLKLADACVIVSEGLKDTILTEVKHANKYKEKINVITNGYEREIKPFKQNIVSENDNKKILKIGYMGQMYQGKRDLTMLFDVINQLVEEGLAQKEEFELHYAGKDIDVVVDQSIPFKLKGIIVNHGFKPRKESLELQRRCNILVTLNWNSKLLRGNLSGKFFEYLMASKPIISLVSGEMPNSELTEMITKMKLGIGCEYVKYEHDIKKLKEYILNSLVEIRKGNSLDFSPVWYEVKKYYYPNLTKKLESLCFQVLKET